MCYEVYFHILTKLNMSYFLFQEEEELDVHDKKRSKNVKMADSSEEDEEGLLIISQGHISNFLFIWFFSNWTQR